jgi:hypothetical protein
MSDRDSACAKRLTACRAGITADRTGEVDLVIVVECPLCHLRFHTRNELEWHGRTDHCHHRAGSTDDTGDQRRDAKRVAAGALTESTSAPPS